MQRTTEIIWALSLMFTLTAAGLDLRTRRIPNWLTVSAFSVGLIMHTIIGGWRGTLFSLSGAALALVLLLPPVLIRVLGAGDWKLMGAVGAVVGPVLMLFILGVSIFAVGLMAMVQMVRARRVVETFRNMWVLFRGFFTFGLKANAQVSLDTPHAMKLPFGVAVALATLLCFGAARWFV